MSSIQDAVQDQNQDAVMEESQATQSSKHSVSSEQLDFYGRYSARTAKGVTKNPTRSSEHTVNMSESSGTKEMYTSTSKPRLQEKWAAESLLRTAAESEEVTFDELTRVVIDIVPPPGNSDITKREVLYPYTHRYEISNDTQALKWTKDYRTMMIHKLFGPEQEKLWLEDEDAILASAPEAFLAKAVGKINKTKHTIDYFVRRYLACIVISAEEIKEKAELSAFYRQALYGVASISKNTANKWVTKRRRNANANAKQADGTDNRPHDGNTDDTNDVEWSLMAADDDPNLSGMRLAPSGRLWPTIAQRFSDLSFDHPHRQCQTSDSRKAFHRPIGATLKHLRHHLSHSKSHVWIANRSGTKAASDPSGKHTNTPNTFWSSDFYVTRNPEVNAKVETEVKGATEAWMKKNSVSPESDSQLIKQYQLVLRRQLRAKEFRMLNPTKQEKVEEAKAEYLKGATAEEQRQIVQDESLLETMTVLDKKAKETGWYTVTFVLGCGEGGAVTSCIESGISPHRVPLHKVPKYAPTFKDLAEHLSTTCAILYSTKENPIEATAIPTVHFSGGEISQHFGVTPSDVPQLPNPSVLPEFPLKEMNGTPNTARRAAKQWLLNCIGSMYVKKPRAATVSRNPADYFVADDYPKSDDGRPIPYNDFDNMFTPDWLVWQNHLIKAVRGEEGYQLRFRSQTGHEISASLALVHQRGADSSTARDENIGRRNGKVVGNEQNQKGHTPSIELLESSEEDGQSEPDGDDVDSASYSGSEDADEVPATANIPQQSSWLKYLDQNVEPSNRNGIDVAPSTAVQHVSTTASENRHVRRSTRSRAAATAVEPISAASCDCLCGTKIGKELFESNTVLKCSQGDCETRWFHLACVKPLETSHWRCDACRPSKRRK